MSEGNINYKVHAKKGDLSGLDVAKAKAEALERRVDQVGKAQKLSAQKTREAQRANEDFGRGLNILGAIFPGVSGAVRGLSMAIKGLSFAGIIGALTILVAIGRMVYSSVFKPMIDGARESRQAIARWVDGLRSVKGTMDSLNAKTSEIDRMATAYNAAADAAGKLAKAEADLRKSREKRQLAEIDVREAAALDKPGLTEDDRSRIKKQFDDERKGVRRAGALAEYADEKDEIDRGYKQSRASIDFASQQAAAAVAERDRAKQNFDLANKKAGDAGVKTVQDDMLRDVGKALSGRMSAEKFSDKYVGMTPQQVMEKTLEDRQKGRMVYTGDSDEAKAAREAQEEFVKLAEAAENAKRALDLIKQEQETNIAVLDKRLEGLSDPTSDFAEEDAIQSSTESAAARSAREEKAEEARKDEAEKAAQHQKEQREKAARARETQKRMDFEEADPEGKRKIIDREIAELDKSREAARKAGRWGDVAEIDAQARAQKKRRNEIVASSKDDPAAPGPGKTGIDSLIDDMAAAGPRGPRMANSRMAQSFRSRLGKSFGDNLMKSSFAKPGDAAPGRLEDNPAKLQREGNSTLKRIEQKLGMRE